MLGSSLWFMDSVKAGLRAPSRSRQGKTGIQSIFLKFIVCRIFPIAIAISGREREVMVLGLRDAAGREDRDWVAALQLPHCRDT